VGGIECCGGTASDGSRQLIHYISHSITQFTDFINCMDFRRKTENVMT